MHTYDARVTETKWTSIRLSAESIKVLAHPLRHRVLSALREHGPATATALAARLETNTGATSYHLRKLAAVDLVEETDEGRGRERWWRASTAFHEWDDEAAEGDPDARSAAGWLREHYLRSLVERTEGWHARHDAWPLAWRKLAGSSDYALDLTPPQLDALMHDLWDTVGRHHESATAANADLPDDLPEDQRPRRVLLYFYDFPEGEPPS